MTTPKYKWIKFRIFLVSFCFVFFLSLILFRSYQLHIAENARLINLASRQHNTVMETSAKRGTIYDRNGKELAVDIQVASVSANPQQIEDKNQVAAQIAPYLSLEISEVNKKLNSSKKFEWLARRISQENGEKIAALKIRGLNVIGEYKRFYPNKEIAGNLLGAVGYDAKALGGLELSFDKYLKGAPIEWVAQKDAKGRLYTPFSQSEVTHDVTLTIDVNLQYITEKFLQENAVKYQAESGFAIVMDPHTGELLAMANYPSFNPNTYWAYPQTVWKNHAIIDSFEPGSTFKSMIAAAALNSGEIKPSDKFFCENGEYKIGTRVIHDHEPYGNLSVSDIMEVSSNIGVTKIAQKVGKQPFYDMIQNLGFGQSSGIGLPGEEKGYLRSPKNWSAIDHSNIAFGQGIAVTGMQMVGAYSIIANGGLKMKPLLVSKIMSSQGMVVESNQPTQMGQIIDPDSADHLTKMLEGVIEEGGTGKLAELPGYRVAGKTGTAQKVDPNTKKYAEGKFVSSFIGYVPTDRPQFVIYVVYDAPKGQHYGGVVAAPVFRNIAKEALAYRGVPPTDKGLAQVELHGLKKN